MNVALVVVGILLLIGAGVVFAQQARALVGTLVGAIGLLMAVAGWVRLDGDATLRTVLEYNAAIDQSVPFSPSSRRRVSSWLITSGIFCGSRM